MTHTRRPLSTPQALSVNVATTYRVTMLYPDSGSTHHITSNPDLIQSSHHHCGKSSILTADGSPPPITLSRNTLMSIQNNQILLNDILLVPFATKSLMYVHKICKDNEVMIEFDS